LILAVGVTETILAKRLLLKGADISINNFSALGASFNFWKSEEIQKIICEMQPHNICGIKNIATQYILDKYKVLFNMCNAGLL